MNQVQRKKQEDIKKRRAAIQANLRRQAARKTKPATNAEREAANKHRAGVPDRSADTNTSADGEAGKTGAVGKDKSASKTPESAGKKE